MDTKLIDYIIDENNKLLANEKFTYPHFGKEKDLTLFIYKDNDYKPE